MPTDLTLALLFAAALAVVWHMAKPAPTMTTTEWRQRMRELNIGVKFEEK